MKLYGKWLNEELVPDNIFGHVYGECSICHKFRLAAEFCSNCGADMRGRRNRMKIKLDEGAKMPTRAHDMDAGFDLYAINETWIPPYGSGVFDTGVHIEIPEGYAGVLISKSGLNVKKDLTSTGLIDAGYTGSITVKLYNHENKAKRIKAGDKISQLVILPVYLPELEEVDSLEETERGSDGFGSTGR